MFDSSLFVMVHCSGHDAYWATCTTSNGFRDKSRRFDHWLRAAAFRPGRELIDID